MVSELLVMLRNSSKDFLMERVLGGIDGSIQAGLSRIRLFIKDLLICVGQRSLSAQNVGSISTHFTKCGMKNTQHGVCMLDLQLTSPEVLKGGTAT